MHLIDTNSIRHLNLVLEELQVLYADAQAELDNSEILTHYYDTAVAVREAYSNAIRTVTHRLAAIIDN